MTAVTGLWINAAVDAEFRTAMEKNRKAAVTAAAYLTAVLILKRQPADFPELMDSLFWGSLVLAAYSDYCTHEIRDFVYLPGIVSGVLRLVQNPVGWENIQELIIFIAVQWILFRLLYGESDCLAFSVCALYMSGSGYGFMGYLCLMSVTFGFVMVVQGCKRNINRKGNLKKPVALIPYITAAMIFFS